MVLEKVKSWFVLISFSIIFLILTLPNLLSQNLIGDEGVYIAEGDQYLHSLYSFYFNSGSPHFLKSLSALFFYPLPLNRDYSPYFKETYTHVWTVANFTYDQNAQFADSIIRLARIPHLLLGLLLGAAIYLLVRNFVSHSAALIALALYTFNALILAHAATANLDLGVTTFSFITIAILYMYFHAKPQHKTKLLILTGFLLGLSQLTKISAILLYPFFLAAPLIFKQYREYKNIAIMFVISLFAIWALYGFQVGAIIMPHDDPAGLESVYGSIPIVKNYKESLTNFLRLPIFPAGAFYNNFTYQFTHSFYGHTVYLNGEFTDKGWWYFIPVLFLYKNSVILIFFSIIATIYISTKKLYKNPLIRYFSLWLLLLIIWSIANKLQLGIRYFMPAYPALFMLIATTLDQIIKNSPHKFTQPLVLTTLALYIVSNLSVFPHFFTYTNEFLRAKNPVHYITDSDYDWGQSVYKLGQIQKEKNLFPLYFEQFGGASQPHYGINTGSDVTTAFNQKQQGYYAFSHSALVNLKKNNPEIFRYFVDQTPTLIIDNTIYVYKTSFE